MPYVQPIVSPTKSTHKGDGSGGISVTKQMHEILDQPGYLSYEMDSQTLHELYCSNSSSFDALKLTYFGLCCYLGEYEKVVKVRSTRTRFPQSLNCQIRKSNLDTLPISKVQRHRISLGILQSSYPERKT